MSNADLSRKTSPVLRTAPEQTTHLHYVDWSAVFAGAIVAAAIFTLMTTFGAAIGLSAASPFPGKGMSATAIGIATALWVVWIAVSSFAVGGYLTGRLRRRIHDASEHESDVRDGAHGLVVWALGALLIAYLTTSSVTGIFKATAGGATAIASGIAQKTAEAVDPLAIASDRLLRGATPSPTATDSLKPEIARILAASAGSGSISADDKAYLGSQIAARSGVTPQEATKRIDDTMAQIAQATDKARELADSARRVSILVAFLTAASLAISAAAAWWAAGLGGNHRDTGVDLSHLTTWR